MLDKPGRGEEDDNLQVFSITTKETEGVSRMMLFPDAMAHVFEFPAAGLGLLELADPESDDVYYDTAPVIVSGTSSGEMVIISTRMDLITQIFPGSLAVPQDEESNALNTEYFKGKPEYFLPENSISKVAFATRESLLKLTENLNGLAEYLDRMPIYTFRSDGLHFQTVYTGNEQDVFGFEFVNLNKDLYIPHQQKIGVKFAKDEKGVCTAFIIAASDNWLKEDLKSPHTELLSDEHAVLFCLEQGFPADSSVFKVTGVGLQYGFYVRSAYKKDVQEDIDKGLRSLLGGDVK